MIKVDDRPRFYQVKFTRGNSAYVTADAFGLRLAAERLQGPLGFASPDGSLGRATLPQGFALDAQNRCYFSERATGDIWYFDSAEPVHSNQPFRRILHFG